jgi:hypothetical protein
MRPKSASYQDHPVVVPQVMHATRGFHGVSSVHIGAILRDLLIASRAICDLLDHGTRTKHGHSGSPRRTPGGWSSCAALVVTKQRDRTSPSIQRTLGTETLVLAATPLCCIPCVIADLEPIRHGVRASAMRSAGSARTWRAGWRSGATGLAVHRRRLDQRGEVARVHRAGHAMGREDPLLAVPVLEVADVEANGLGAEGERDPVRCGMAVVNRQHRFCVDTRRSPSLAPADVVLAIAAHVQGAAAPSTRRSPGPSSRRLHWRGRLS